MAVLYSSVLASRVGFGVIIILFPLYIMNASDIQTAVALALYPILEAAVALPLGRVCDTRGRKAVFISSLGYIAVLMASIGLTRNLYAVSAIHALMGIGAAGVTVATLTMVTDLTESGYRGTGMGGFDFANVGGYGLGLIVGSALRTFFEANLGEAFFVTGLAVALAFVASALVLKEPRHPLRTTDRSLNPLKAIDAHAKAMLPIWFGVTVLLGMVFFLPRAFGRANIGGSQTAIILVGGLAILGIGAVGFGALSDRVGRGRVVLVGIVGVFGLLSTLFVSFQGGTNTLYANAPMLGVFALLTSALVPSILATVGDRAEGERRGSAMGLYSVMLSGGSAIGTLVAGFAHSRSGLPGILEAGIVLFAVVCLVSLALWLRAKTEEAGKPL